MPTTQLTWAAAVAAFAEDGQGLNLFIRAIPYNFYALLTIVMMLGLVVLNVDGHHGLKTLRDAGHHLLKAHGPAE